MPSANITITTREAAAALGISLRTAQRWAATGKLTATKTGGRWSITIPADLRDYKQHQINKARELIEDGGIVPFRGRRIFRAVSSDGTRTYLTAPQACTCAAGLKGRHACLHRIAAIILAAA
ncbi:helix-turn-helix domain-containing protein [Microtetraspora malaysiensis]|uniref:Helix-turn-helix domain-containing protein n=1 Tax=Microtetraspora malaysiensis TaxID=161358 RepID=A0ABW6SKB7_9ACTN